MEAFERLLLAIEDRDVLAVRQLVTAQPALLDQTNKYGCTALMHAVSCPSRQVAVIEELLDAGAKVNWQTSEGYTALHYAIDVNFEANLNSREVITALVDAGADLTLKQHYGWTPLLQAVVAGTPVEVDTLLSVGANPNETLPQDTLPAFNAGHTTLMAALPTCDCEAKIESLLLAGADLRARDSNGATFFDYCADLLSQYPEGELAEEIIRCREIARKFDRGAS